MDRADLYEKMALRKDKPKDYQPYDGSNGRVNKCVNLMRSGNLLTGGTLLDVGGGIGDLGYAVRDLFSRRITADISTLSLKAAEAKENETFLCDVDRQGFSGIPSGDVDVVTALDFIEHIIDPESFARECHRVLRQGGEIFVNTPNIRFWRHIEKLWLDGRFPHTSGDREVYHGGHLAFFTYSDLCEIFGNAGFRPFPQIKDEECFAAPPSHFIQPLHPKNQQEFVNLSLELGCPNLLFKAVK